MKRILSALILSGFVWTCGAHAGWSRVAQPATRAQVAAAGDSGSQQPTKKRSHKSHSSGNHRKHKQKGDAGANPPQTPNQSN